jgi:hypothetical protein
MTITIALDSDNPRKLRELAKFINELANITEIEKLDETNERKIDVTAKPVITDIAGNTDTVTLPFFPKSWKNVEKIEAKKVTDPNVVFKIVSEHNELPNLSTAQILAIVEPVSGLRVHNTDDDVVYEYDGSKWVDLEAERTANCGVKFEPTEEISVSIANAAMEEAQQYFKTPETVEQDESASNELDASGLPWDARLHSRTKSKTTDGLWRRQRGLSPSKANKLELEIRASVTDAQKIAHEESKPIAAPPPPPFTHVQAPPPPPAAPTEDKYIALVKKITIAVETEKLSYEKVKDILMQFGIADLAALKNVPHLYAVIDQQVSEVARA